MSSRLDVTQDGGRFALDSFTPTIHVHIALGVTNCTLTANASFPAEVMICGFTGQLKTVNLELSEYSRVRVVNVPRDDIVVDGLNDGPYSVRICVGKTIIYSIPQRNSVC